MIGRAFRLAGCGLLAVASLAPAGLPLAPVQAQVSSEPVCMVRMTTGRPRGDGLFYLIVHPSRVATYTARGFEVAPCGGREEKLPVVAERMCALAARPDDVGGSAFREIHGVSADEICELARGLGAGR